MACRPGCYGFSDCIILSGTDCHVVDFKYGKGITVSAEENPQMMAVCGRGYC